jgi:hypothetical protein
MSKTTDKQFLIFKRECKKWVKIWGLKSWDIDYRLGDTDGAAACTQANINQHYAVITLSNAYDANADFRKKTIRNYAFHEVLHVLFAHINGMISKERYRESEIDKELHAIFRLLENVVLK